MSEERQRFFNAERVLFGVLAALLILFVWRAGFLDPVVEFAESALTDAGLRVALPRATEPLPELPGPPFREDVAGERPPPGPGIEQLAIGSRNPFAPATDTLQVIAADLTALVKVEPKRATADLLVRYWILPQPVSRFTLLLPPGVQLSEIEGSGVIQPGAPRKTADGNLYTVPLRSPVRKRFPLRLQIVWAKPEKSDILEVPDVVLPEATHQSGLIALAKQRKTPVTLLGFENLMSVEEIDKLTLPPALSETESDRYRLFAAFRYTHDSPRPHSIKLNMSKGFTLARRRRWVDRGKRDQEPKKDPEPGEREEPTERKGVPFNPETKVKKPGEEDGEKEKPIEITKAGPDFKLPVTYMGVFRVDAENTYNATLRGKTGAPVKVGEGDVVYGLTVKDIGPGYVLVENEEGKLFKLGQ